MCSFDAVFIDFYGTVSAGDRQAVHDACATLVQAFRLAMTPGELAVHWGERFFQAVDRSNHEAFRSLYECECSSLLDTLRPVVGDFDPAPYVAPLEDYWRDPPLHDDAADFLAGLSLPVCCVSNADAGPLAAAIAKHGLRFDAVVSSQDARCYKPANGIFRRAAEALDVRPSRVLHVGDSLHSDIGGAAKLGITTAWVCRSERIHDIGTVAADHTVSSLRQIPALLG